jgi:SpoIIAA-like
LIETVTDLPAGTLGFRASGTISSDEYRQMMEPAYAALERGKKLNIYFELTEDFHGLDSGALLAGPQSGRLGWPEAPILLGPDGTRHRQGLGPAQGERVRLARTGELRLFERSEQEEARAWLGATSSP